MNVWRGLAAPLVAASVAAAAWLAGTRGGGAAEWGPVPRAWLDGVASLHAGDAAAAAAALAEAEAVVRAPPPALLRARLHAALRSEQRRVAEYTAEKLAVAGDPAGLVDFTRALSAYAAARLAAAAADVPGADPTALDRGIADARRAAAGFQRASLAQPDAAPPARRNAERALVLLAELERRKQLRDQQKKREPDREPPPPDPDQVEREERELPLDDRSSLLTAAELQALLERLAQAEQEKRSLRQKAQRARGAAVERDW
jgi:hypothetical protein